MVSKKTGMKIHQKILLWIETIMEEVAYNEQQENRDALKTFIKETENAFPQRRRDKAVWDSRN